MGHAKEQMMQEGEQGWSFTDEFVCVGCVDDDALEAAIRTAESAESTCGFCGSSPAAPLDVLLEAFVNGLRNEFENAANSVGWESREGGYQWSPIWDTYDLVDEFDTVLVGDGLLDAVRGAIHDISWVEYDFVTRRRDVVLSESWERFCDAVRYETRYVLWLRASDEDDEGAGEVPAAKILDAVGGLVDRLGPIRTLPAGYRLWRAQVHEDATIDHTAQRLGTAPRERALDANRMSPAGIPMFYGAADVHTAIREVALGAEHDHVTWGQFGLSTDTVVVDFTDLPGVASMFDPVMGSMRRDLIFLHNFVEQLRDRARPKHEQIDYVPTQIVTEYLLRVHDGGNRVQGLLYKSSLNGVLCAVLDVPNDRCVDQLICDHIPVQLLLVPGTVQGRLISTAEREGHEGLVSSE